MVLNALMLSLALAAHAATPFAAAGVPLRERPALEPRLQRRILPEFPPAARRAGLAHRVVVEGRIDTQGRVVDLSLPPGGEDEIGFAAATVRALSEWRYAPARDVDGMPVSVSVQFDVLYTP